MKTIHAHVASNLPHYSLLLDVGSTPKVSGSRVPHVQDIQLCPSPEASWLTGHNFHKEGVAKLEPSKLGAWRILQTEDLVRRGLPKLHRVVHDG